MVIGILQPSYLPWFGFFEQICRSDIFIIYDDVQYDKHGWRNRNKIKTCNGVQWLTVPVSISLKNSYLIKDVRINGGGWRKKHFFSIKQNYSKSPFFKEYINLFEDAYSKEWEYLIDINIYFILMICDIIGITEKKIIRSSTLNIKGSRNEKLINICKLFNANIFYEGASGRNYIDERLFVEQGIKVEYQDYNHPVYKQLHGDFVPYLSVIDLLFNHGEESLPILLNGKTLED